MTAYTVRAHRDAEAQVWWAESDDVPGLVAEAATHDLLVEEVRQVVPAMLSLNLPGLDHAGARLRIVADQVVEVC